MKTANFSPPRLHPPVVQTLSQAAFVNDRIQTIAQQRNSMARFLVAPVPGLNPVELPLTTVSLAKNFDANVSFFFEGSTPNDEVSAVVDSGNTALIVPFFEDLQNLPNFATNYQVLGDGQEPWRSSGKVVKGPIHFTTVTGGIYTVPDCIFFACTSEPRTSNVGIGCINPWSKNFFQVDAGLKGQLRSPFSFDIQRPYAEIFYSAGPSLLSLDTTPKVLGGSSLLLSPTQPRGYSMFDVLPGLAWMSVRPLSLGVATFPSTWTGGPDDIAMIDTGGGPVLFNDPTNTIINQPLPAAGNPPVDNFQNSNACKFTYSGLVIELSGLTGPYRYTIDSRGLLPGVQGMTLIACQLNEYLEGNTGMNIGGISCLFNRVLIDYAHNKIGLKPA